MTHPQLKPTMSRTMAAPAGSGGFASRHIGPSTREIDQMLATIGVASVEELIDQTVPSSIRLQRLLRLGTPLTESEAISHLRSLASKNEVLTSLIGMGYHDTLLPPVIQRNILENPAWYTAYTPYQPEISQGRLEALLNFQTMVCDLTALDIANASLLDEATAAAEAMLLARRASTCDSATFFVDENVHPQTLAVLRTRAEPLGWSIITGPPEQAANAGRFFGALFQYPGTFGDIPDLRLPIKALHSAGAIVSVAADPLALTLLAPPGEIGADVAVGSTQRFGVPMGYGGPHAAYIAVKDTHKRHLPGRLVGMSVDGRGAPAYRLALQTREQHIRREKATSNICTAQVLLAVIASMYAVYHGPEGLVDMALSINRRTATLAAGLRKAGYRLRNDTFFDTVTVIVGDEQQAIVRRARAERLNLRIIPGNAGSNKAIGVSFDETTTDRTIEAVLRAFGATNPIERTTVDGGSSIPNVLRRRSPFLRHAVFHQHRSETALLRYMRKLSDRDLALDRSMIPLGSCTMKLNGTTEMLPVTWTEFNGLHPYAPAEQARGYAEIFESLEAALCEITGYDACCLQPNSGAQGELAGLLAIRGYHRSRNEAQRNICLIPSSAHGTNPASAVLAGMEVITVRCDLKGNVDLDDLKTKVDQFANRLAAIMVTYPSTHGVFEERIRELCELVHEAGGQVYIDGANLNAQVGLARPGDYGGDVSHLNLHKTFCIPHGGGGPGMGPIGVKAHLAPFLPRHPLDESGVAGPVAAAAHGSASILPIAYLYVLLMGSQGLHLASKIAIVSANYIACRLHAHFPVLYKNARGRVAHECILDPRRYKDSCGVTVDDIAKRLIDFGFHAPTMSFPVPGTLMIEPTESESKAELDRFCDAMIAIREEIRDLENGRYPLAQSPLRLAPHTVADLVTEDWNRPYSRTVGCLPGSLGYADKYWPPVGRVDNVYGDRNLVCTCPPLDDYATHKE